MKNDIILSSMAMDFKRVALGYYRGSPLMADRFLQEALKRKKELDRKTIKPYLLNILNETERYLRTKNDLEKAERFLMYATLVQNYVLKIKPRSL